MDEITKPKPFKIKNKLYKTTKGYYRQLRRVRALPTHITKDMIDTALFTWVVQYGSSAVSRTHENTDRVSTLWGLWYGSEKSNAYRLVRKANEVDPFDDRFILTPVGLKYFNLLCSEGGESNE